MASERSDAPLTLWMLAGVVFLLLLGSFWGWRDAQLQARAECATRHFGELTQETWMKATRETCNPSPSTETP